MAIINNLPMGGSGESISDMFVPFAVDIIKGKSSNTYYLTTIKPSVSSTSYVQVSYRSSGTWTNGLLYFVNSSLDDGEEIEFKLVANYDFTANGVNNLIGGALSSATSFSSYQSYGIPENTVIHKGDEFYYNIVRNGSNRILNLTDGNGNSLITNANVTYSYFIMYRISNITIG